MGHNHSHSEHFFQHSEHSQNRFDLGVATSMLLHQEASNILSRALGVYPDRVYNQSCTAFNQISFAEPFRVRTGCMRADSLNGLVDSGVISDKRIFEPEKPEAMRMADLKNSLLNGSATILEQSPDRSFISAARNPQIQPDLLIRTDGTVEMHHASNKMPLIVQIERGPNNELANPKQMEAARELDRWIDQRHYKEAQMQEQLANQQRINEVNNRFDQSGRMSPQEARDYFPQRDETEARRNKEPFDVASVMDTLAFMFHPDKIKPYDTLRHGPSGYEIGRYGISANIFMDYLSGLPEFAEMLGTPPDMSKLPLLMKHLGKNHKIPAKFAEHFGDKNFSQEFVQFMGKMESGQGNLSKQEIEKFFPKELQESVMNGIAVNAVHKGTDAATLALAFHLGKPVSELDKEDMADKSNQQYMATSMKVLGLALAKHQSGPNDEIDWKRTDNGKQSSGSGTRGADDSSSSQLAFSIARAAENNANRVGTVGWCYREVANTLDRFGIHLSGSSAYMAAPQLAANKHFKEVSTEHLKKGTVLVFGPSQGHPHGHITVYLGNGKEASDHVQSLVNFKHYGGVRAFEPT